jgi:hypothetical protein
VIDTSEDLALTAGAPEVSDRGVKGSVWDSASLNLDALYSIAPSRLIDRDFLPAVMD